MSDTDFDLKELKAGDKVYLYGSKLKLSILSDQSTSGRMRGWTNTNVRVIRFRADRIQKVEREGKVIYYSHEE